MTEAFFTAAELNVGVPHILWVHVKKHLSAIATFMQDGSLRSEDIRSRLSDVANYMALIDSYVVDPGEWLFHLDRLISLSQFPSRTPDEMRMLQYWIREQRLIHPQNART
jgi:hypothetical protein